MLDVVFIHSNGDDVKIQQGDATLLTGAAGFETARISVRAIGMSGKTEAGARRALDWADAIMVEYHLHDQSCASA